MYTRKDTPKYCCRACNNKIPIADLEAIFHDELKAFLANSKKLASHLVSAGETLAQKESQITGIQESIQKVREEMTRTHRLYLDGQITTPRIRPVLQTCRGTVEPIATPKLQAEIDLLKVNRLSAEEIMAEATTLYERWPKLPADGRRKIAEAVRTEKSL